MLQMKGVICVHRAIDVAEYFLSKDPERKLFTKKLQTKNDRKFYEGNARLNKYLHMAQNVFIAKTGERLFGDNLYAYDNGAVAVDVQENYSVLWSRCNAPAFTPELVAFLDKLYFILENAPLDELIEISHEDPEWADKHRGYSKESQRMDSLSRFAEYKKQYADVIEMMERISI